MLLFSSSVVNTLISTSNLITAQKNFCRIESKVQFKKGQHSSYALYMYQECFSTYITYKASLKNIFVSDFTAAKKVILMRDGGNYFIFLLLSIEKSLFQISQWFITSWGRRFLSLDRRKSNQQQYVTGFKLPFFQFYQDCSKN